MKLAALIVFTFVAGTIAIAPAVANSAGNAPGMEGSYVGVGVDPLEAEGDLREVMRSGHPALWLVNEVFEDGEGSPTPDRQFQGRIDLPNSRLSVRGTVLMGEQNRVIMPSLSYDMPIGEDANIYAGAGYAFVNQDGVATPLGDRDGIVITTGAEASINRNIVIYGNVGIRPDRAIGSDDGQVRFQLGIGHRF